MDQVARYLYSLIGMETPRLKGRMHVRDRALLYYAGILAQQPRSMAGLKRILTDYFQVQVKTTQFVGQWCELEESQWTTIGVSGANQRLGRDTVIVGTQVWDQHARFEIQLGPLDLDDFESFLPTEWRFGVLCDLVRFYIRDEFEFNVRLILKSEQIPQVKLSMDPALSWTSWLGPSDISAADEDPYIVISPEELRSVTGSKRSRLLYRLPRGKHTELLRMMKRRAQKHEVLMRQGQPGTSMFIIRHGEVQLSRRDERGREIVLGNLVEGDCFGESALLRKKPYSETALALTDCELSVLRLEHLEYAMEKDPIFKRMVEAYLNCVDPEAHAITRFEFE
jgi:hypothetical protein